MKIRALVLIVIAFCFLPQRGQASDCRSELGAHLKPITATSPFSWALETTLVAGAMENSDLNRTFNSQMLYGGLDFSATHHQLYFETGLKYWSKSDEAERTGTGNGTGSSLPTNFYKPEKRHWGLREFFYGFHKNDTQIKVGLQSMKFNQSLLLDERVLGASFEQTLHGWDVALKTGTVATDFARMGDFCGTRHVYRLLPNGRFNLVSDQLWETNFVGTSLSWQPSRETEEPNVMDDDGFSMESFSSFEETTPPLIQEIRLIFYEEFGSGFHTYKYYLGSGATFNLPLNLDLNTEILYQAIQNENALAYRIQCQKDWAWNSGALSGLNIMYWGKYAFDAGSRFYPAFSNLYLGEVMRLDALDLPCWTASVRHAFAFPLKPAIELYYLKQSELDHVQEWDMQLSAHVYRGLVCYGIFSQLQSDAVGSVTNMAKVEMRWAF